MLDAYTVRKAVPRILIAVIGINISIYLCIAAVDLTNIVGSGISSLLVDPFIKANAFGGSGIENNIENGVVAGALVAAIFGTGALGIWVIASGAGFGIVAFLIPIIITVGLITLAVIFTLIIRQALLIFLIVISPVAIALFVLPGTEKYFRQWLDLFVKTLLVYPIVSVLFAMSTVLTAILIGTAPLSSDGIGVAKIIGALIVAFAPLVLIPFAFKLAGGAIAAVMNVANGRVTNTSARTAKRIAQSRQDPNTYLGAKERDRRKAFADTRAGIYNRNVDRRGIRGAAGRLIGGKRSDAIQSAEGAESGKYVESIGATGNDDYVRAATLDMEALRGDQRRWRRNGDGTESFMAPTGQWFSEGQIRAGKSKFKSEADLAAAHRYVMSKTENVPAENQDMVLQDFVNYANNSGLDAGKAAGDWAGVAIPNQRMRADLRYTSITRDAATGRLTARRNDSSFLDNMGTQQGFSLASQQEGTFESLTEAYLQESGRLRDLNSRVVATPAGSAERAQLELQRNQMEDRLHNVKGNLEKFVGTTAGRGVPRPAEEGGGVDPGSAYGGSSSASYKVEQAARLALEEITAHDPSHQAREFSGGGEGDRVVRGTRPRP